MKMTDCQVWQQLEAHHKVLSQIPLKKLFVEIPQRFQHFSAETAGLFIDYSKNWMTQETLDLLCALAKARGVTEAIDNLFSGKKINHSEGRAALHTALRMPAGESLVVAGADLSEQVQAVLQQMENISDALHQGRLTGYSGKPIDTVLHVGIGGSDLGPALLRRIMQTDKTKIKCHLLTEFDYSEIESTLSVCNPETTIAVIVSKSFSTQETLTIADTIKIWLSDAAGNDEKIQKHFYAVTANSERALAQHYLPSHILAIWDWVGGRYSVWSAVSFSIVLTFGMKRFKAFLAGANQMDMHFQQTPLNQNMPVIMALLSVWYNQFFHARTKAIVPYSARLSVLPTYLQQLHMESLGKGITTTGHPVNYKTGRVIWGNVGPNSQHSFHQFLMQGTEMVPIDFILPLRVGSHNSYDIKRAAYCLSQSQTLMQGFNASDSPHLYQHIEGNRPSTTILIDSLTPESIGALLALYEHQVFVQSIIWDINPFDQWGVECGKKIAKTLMENIFENKMESQFDTSTQGLLERISGRFQS